MGSDLTISSPGYPLDYNLGFTCIYALTAPAGYKVKMVLASGASINTGAFDKLKVREYTTCN